MEIPLIFTIIIISFISYTEIKSRNERIKQLEKDWKFCKSLLDKTRNEPTKE